MCVPHFIQIQLFEVKKASEAKIGQTKKQKLHEMLDLLCFRRKSLESSGP